MTNNPTDRTVVSEYIETYEEGEENPSQMNRGLIVYEHMHGADEVPDMQNAILDQQLANIESRE